MTIQDDDRPGDDGVLEAVPDRGSRRRKQVAAAVAGLALLGAGSYAITAQVMDRNKTTTAQKAGVVEPAPEVGSADSVTTASPSSSTKAKAKTKADSVLAPAVSESGTVDERIKAAREYAAKHGSPVQHALTAAPNAAAPVGQVTVTNHGTFKEGGTTRVISARYDLTGQREMLWVADDGKKVGDAECTQKFRFSNESKGAERPTMVMCWRTSAKKSVIVVSVDAKGKPDASKSVATLNKRWAEMG
ncbi:hypothetical protein [Paractinoplanes durhamensis]|uniref:Uncharacterized protein n=1 Tax=Paractinoplanes durhamensis TaxID=113563 RepID=A0ABQ3Z9S1_9ACTN|nr:hypothetical protein [Actinoplanes durhamensis]GIE06580.1 hypothetical protein Adu01nite_79300 [Actinoplanes durhamensis]